MQASRLSKPSPANTRQRILDAAGRVFAKHGLAGSTTRAIAEEAGVNEVTLFRHFQNKDGLLAAVVGEHFPKTDDSVPPVPTVTSNLRADLIEIAHRYEALLQENLSLVRTMIGEIHHRHRDQERQVFFGIFRPIKSAIRQRIEIAQQSGDLRTDRRADVLADLFASMIFTGVLRRDAPEFNVEYSAESYLNAAVDLLLGGAASSLRPTT